MATTTPPIYSLYIVNKSGGAIFQSDFSKEAQKLGLNTQLRLASTFHSLYAIAANITPTSQTSSGIQVVETEHFRLHGYQSPTGVKFFILAHPERKHLDQLLRTIYELFSDYVLKNPFYELEQPIHCQQFDMALDKLLRT
eukprot:CAMPEP_0201494320 /NCGR_PEP_ID=MMETSP0151_2-20130828/46598_1 /ASSEMBLY_ACC=CAM_ASM_000257 /TAXON_ID=200890 /ORGANISM="Paramoeba atlantica, Strain 621/1 / CCAP 1560/9" /LENGTH=139 /DNA_ID=CAMNT_0047882469 /DNA_START=56 /DNA_END=471 /DNA_ORIENTATION=+